MYALTQMLISRQVVVVAAEQMNMDQLLNYNTARSSSSSALGLKHLKVWPAE